MKYDDAMNPLVSTISKQVTKHLNWFLRTNSAPDILALKVFPNPKEITESIGAMRAVFDYIPVRRDADGVQLISVADGCTPRTAAAFAFYTKWNVVSVDPILKEGDKWEEKICRLTCHAKTIQDYLSLFNHQEGIPSINTKIFVGVHPHVNVAFHAYWYKQDHPEKDVYCVAIPCCQDISLKEMKPQIEYLDAGILSPKRIVRIWAFQEKEKKN